MLRVLLILQSFLKPHQLLETLTITLEKLSFPSIRQTVIHNPVTKTYNGLFITKMLQYFVKIYEDKHVIYQS